MRLTGIDYCKWNNGAEWVEQQGLDLPEVFREEGDLGDKS